MTFTELIGPPPEHGCGFHPQHIRTARRSLRKMVDNGAVIAIGYGGRRDPHRYCVNPAMIAMAGDKAELETLVANLTAASSPAATP